MAYGGWMEYSNTCCGQSCIGTGKGPSPNRSFLGTCLLDLNDVVFPGDVIEPFDLIERGQQPLGRLLWSLDFINDSDATDVRFPVNHIS